MLIKFKLIFRNDNILINFNIMDNESDISIIIVYFYESRMVSIFWMNGGWIYIVLWMMRE